MSTDPVSALFIGADVDGRVGAHPAGPHPGADHLAEPDPGQFARPDQPDPTRPAPAGHTARPDRTEQTGDR